MAWPPGRLHDGNALVGDVVAQIGGGSDAVAQIIFFQRLLHANGNGFKVAAGKAAVGGIALGENQADLFPAPRARSSLVQRKPPMLAMPSFLADMVQPSPSEHLLRDLLGSLCVVAFFAQLDEVGVLGEAAGVEVERNAVLPANRADGASVLHRDRLAAAGVVGDGEHDQRNAFAADTLRSEPPARPHPCCL